MNVKDVKACRQNLVEFDEKFESKKKFESKLVKNLSKLVKNFESKLGRV